mmetsp:Transcript_109380/g.185742  ORF Transcript_109380/g.185742 Transcript_109380/m.185742 type:complete len:225 (-) Transcript_109380:375-1049(-)
MPRVPLQEPVLGDQRQPRAVRPSPKAKPQGSKQSPGVRCRPPVSLAVRPLCSRARSWRTRGLAGRPAKQPRRSTWSLHRFTLCGGADKRGGGGMGPKSLCTKNSPIQYFLLCISFFPTMKSGSRKGGWGGQWLTAVLIHPCGGVLGLKGIHYGSAAKVTAREGADAVTKRPSASPRSAAAAPRSSSSRPPPRACRAARASGCWDSRPQAPGPRGPTSATPSGCY